MSGRGVRLRLLARVCMIVPLSVIATTVWPQQLHSQAPRRSVAVYQFNSGLPDIPGPTVREMFVAALVRTGRFVVAPPNQPGTEFIIDGVINEANLANLKIRPEWNDILKGLLTSDVRPFSFDLRIVDARTGIILDYINVTSKDIVDTKLNLADVGSALGSDKARRDAIPQRLLPYLNEAVKRVVARYAIAPTSVPTEPSGFPLQQGYPSANQPGTQGYGQSGQPTGLTAPYYSQTQPAQVRARGGIASAPDPTPERLMAGFDPTQHEVADVRGTLRESPRDGSTVIHIAPSGHTLYATIRSGRIENLSATDGEGREAPLNLLNNKPDCWVCAMGAGICWKLPCPLEGDAAPPEPARRP
jgi:hypothetical protein